jgi:ATP-dependent helicase/nuclease subunit B
MAEGSGPNIFNIPLHRAFADALAAGLLAQSAGDRMVLARTTILLPNSRAQRTLTDAFVRRSGSGGLLLPRMVAIGDSELDERVGAALDPADDSDPIRPAVEPIERQFLLARLVQQVRKEAGDPVDAAEAMRLASDLARTLDQLIVEEIPPHRIRDIVPATLSHHWQTSLAIMETLLDRWPRELAARRRIDLAERRNILLDRAATRFRNLPVDADLLVAAGITVAAPAVARLLRSVAHSPHGMVILPGLDREMPEEEWDALGPLDSQADGERIARSIETHPQFNLKILLDRVGIARTEVRPWRWGGRSDAPAARSRAVSNAMAPARYTAKWQTLKPADRRLSGVRTAIFATPGEEAQAIAVALREAIETPGRTAALVTPDRALARRVSAHLKRWNIEADDSAGEPLSVTPPGTLLLALAEVLAEDFAPVPLLAMLKHPLVRAGEGRIDWLEGVRLLDRALRGPRPPGGMAGITAFLAEGDVRERKNRAPAAAWWHVNKAGLEIWRKNAAKLEMGSLLAAIRQAASELTGDQVWAGAAGRQAADLFMALEAAAVSGPQILRIETLPIVLRDLLDGVAIRPPQGGHPRIAIRGLIEARLAHEDLTILGGLNEGVWPAVPVPDPWLAPSIRRELGLPGLERRIGLAAHDFASALGAPQVLITRARRDVRAPTIASRFFLRLEAMTGGITRATQLGQWTAALDRPSGPPDYAMQPAPSPPVSDRPRKIAVTKLDRLQADPFAFYADAMLGLTRWDSVDADPTPAWRGTMVHAVFVAWMKEDDCHPAKLRPRAKAMLSKIASHPVLKALWEPRLLEAVDWVAAMMEANAGDGRLPVTAEVFGETDIGGVRVYGKVDRIDRLKDGKLAIIDYKTGQPPSRKQVEAGFAMQLGLLGLIAERNGFPDIKGVPGAFEYWSLARKAGEFGYIASPISEKGIAAEDFTTHATACLVAAIETWLTGEEPFTAKLHPELSPYSDYDQLMRLDEWYGRGDV